MSSTITSSQSNREPLGISATGDSHHACASHISAATMWCYHVNIDQNLQFLVDSVPWRIKEALKAKGELKNTHASIYLAASAFLPLCCSTATPFMHLMISSLNSESEETEIMIRRHLNRCVTFQISLKCRHFLTTSPATKLHRLKVALASVILQWKPAIG